MVTPERITHSELFYISSKVTSLSRLVHCCNIRKQPSIHMSIHNNACVGTHLYSVGTHQGYLLKSLVSMSRMTCFIPGDLFDIPGSGKSMRGYILACSRHQRENICQRMGYEQRELSLLRQQYCTSLRVHSVGRRTCSSKPRLDLM